MVVIGCGFVGLCVIISVMEYKFKKFFVVDGVKLRLELVRGFGVELLDLNEFGREGIVKRVREVMEGRGVDVVVEVVGLSFVLRIVFEVLRLFGVVSSIGVYNGEILWGGDEVYG